MNRFLWLVVEAYSRTLNLYPRKFREEFAGEMSVVIRSSVMDAAEEGIVSLILVCGREFMGMPFHILKEHLHEMQGGEADMQLTYYYYNETLPYYEISVNTTRLCVYGASICVGAIANGFVCGENDRRHDFAVDDSAG